MKSIKTAIVSKGKPVVSGEIEDLNIYIRNVADEFAQVASEFDFIFHLPFVTFAYELKPKKHQGGYITQAFSNPYLNTPWRALVAVSNEQDFAHEIGHLVEFLWEEYVSQGQTIEEKEWDFIKTHPFLNLLKDAENEELNVREAAPTEVFARMFETYISYRLIDVYGSLMKAPYSCYSFWGLSYGFMDDNHEPFHMVGYAFAADWEYLNYRFHRMILRMLRQIKRAIEERSETQ